MESGLFFFDSFRPVPLQQEYIGISEKNFWNNLNWVMKLHTKIVSQENQTRYSFCALKEGHIENGKGHELGAWAKRAKLFCSKRQCNDGNIGRTSWEHVDTNLKDIHHMVLVFIMLVSVKMIDALCELIPWWTIKVLVSTATLAWGVNLPAHCDYQRDPSL